MHRNKHAAIFDGSYIEKILKKLLHTKQISGYHMKRLITDIEKRCGVSIVSVEFHQGTPYGIKSKLHHELEELGIKVVNYEMKTQSGWSDVHGCNVSMTVERATDVGLAVAAVFKSIMEEIPTIVVSGDGDLSPVFHRLLEFRTANAKIASVTVCAGSSSLSGILKANEFRFKDTDGVVYDLDIEIPKLFGIQDTSNNDDDMREKLDKITKILCKCARNGDIDAIDSVLSKTNLPVFKIRDVLLVAIKYEQVEIFKFLIDKILSGLPNCPHIRIKEILTEALVVACDHGNSDIIGYLIEREVDLDQKHRSKNKERVSRYHDQTPLMVAVHQKHTHVIKQLINAGADPNVCTEEGKTALMIACATLDSELVEGMSMLIDTGACLNQQDKNGRTALMHAAVNGNLSMVKLLTTRGADIGKRSKSDMTACQLAMTFSHTNIVNYLSHIIKLGDVIHVA